MTNKEKMSKQLVGVGMKARRKTGKLRKRWTHETEENLKKMGITN